MPKLPRAQNDDISNQLALDFPKAANLCAQALFYDKLDAFFFPKEERKLSRQKVLYDYFLRSNAKNICTTSPRLEGLMIFEKPFAHEDQLDFFSILSGFPLLRFGIGTIMKMMHFQLNAISIRKDMPFSHYCMIR